MGFSVNVEFSQDDLFKLKSLIINFVKKHAESSVVKYYRPGEKEDKNGLTIGKNRQVGDPEQKKFEELLDIVKTVEKSEEDKKAQIKIIIPLPI